MFLASDFCNFKLNSNYEQEIMKCKKEKKQQIKTNKNPTDK